MASNQPQSRIAEPATSSEFQENAFMLVSLQGQSLGKYRILEPLGRGGMAQVYRAYHPQLDRYVAVKVLRSDLVEDEEFLTRFRREAQSVANLRHPNIVQIHDFDFQDDIYYMVMELLEGDTLKAQLNQRRARAEGLPQGEMVRILLDILEGLAYAHNEGIIHRDIKPANIMLTKRGQAVISDFGIAQILGSTQFTVSGALMGTLSYMAPEQGLEGRTGVHSDLYSLGVVFYEMLTGQPPFDADTPLAILMKHVNDPLPLPRSINPNIPEPFERLALKALAKDSEDRFQSAEEMAKAVQDVSDQTGITIPDRITLPERESASITKSDSVAVISGPDREHISEAHFANDETEITLGDRLAKQDQPEPKVTEEKHIQTEASSELTPEHDVGKAAARAWMTAAVVLIGFNLMAVFYGLVSSNWRIYQVGWPAEVLLVSLGFCLMMGYGGASWMMIPGGILLGNGVLFAFYSITGWWNLWRVLWPLEPLLVMGAVLYALWMVGRGDQRPSLAVQAGKWMTQLAFVVLVITIAVSAIPIR